MMYYNYFYCAFLLLTQSSGSAQEIDIIENIIDTDATIKLLDVDIADNSIPLHTDKVTLKVYYECLCPACRDFDTHQLLPVIQKLPAYLDIHTYPYGNAQTIVDENGHYRFFCQHGEAECYGNKLHACALDILKNRTEALLFNACMMDFSQQDGGSDDSAADNCAKSMAIDTVPIKSCAKSDQGSKLLYYYGEESKKVSYNGVPYVLLNGAEYYGDDLLKAVCADLINPPPPCY